MENNSKVLLISKYRTHLMGVAILNVVFGHLFSIGHFEFMTHFGLYRIINLCWLLFTGGFLFLSGYGMFFSCLNNNTLMEFYKRRVKRIYLPYLLIASPFIIVLSFLEGFSIINVFARLTTLGYWYEGNYAGTWYIAASLILYFVYPFFHMFIYIGDEKSIISKFCSSILLLIICTYLLNHFAYDFYMRTILFFSQFIVFFIGSFIAYLLSVKKVKQEKIVFYSFFFYVIFELLNFDKTFFSIYGKNIYNIVWIMIFIVLFEMYYKKLIMHKILVVLKWLGKYTLEIYLLHLLVVELLLKCSVNNNLSIILAIIISFIFCAPCNRFVNIIIHRLEF